MGWDETAGRVSRAFNDWFLVDSDQRAFLALGLRFAQEAYARLWDEAGSEPGDPEGPDQVDSFEAKVDGLWEHDYQWLHAAAVLRDAVSAFEVYLEKAREEILQHHGIGLAVADHAPTWGVLRRFFAQLSVEVEPSAVHDVRELRHFLTHRRGELRTEALRKRFAAGSSGLPLIFVELDEVSVLTAMSGLAAAVRQVDATVYSFTWGGQRISGLQPSR